VDIEAVSIDTEKEEIARIFTDTKFSRLPVYKDSIDDIVGVIHQKDFYVNGSVIAGSIEEIMTPPVFVQCTVKINNLLKMLQQQKSHIAVVLDEYGGTYGIVTMEDILEELVGEIWDEHDEVVEEYKEISENTYQFDCSMNMEDFAEFFDREIEAESVSLSGWVTEMLEKIPDVGDSFTYEDLSITVLATDAHRVETVEVRRLEETPEEAKA